MPQASVSCHNSLAAFFSLMLCAQLRHILTSIGERLSEEEVDELIREVDVDGDGDIHCQELASIMVSAFLFVLRDGAEGKQSCQLQARRTHVIKMIL